MIGNEFANALSVTVKANNPIEPVDGGVIHFTAPTTGASATLSGGYGRNLRRNRERDRHGQ